MVWLDGCVCEDGPCYSRRKADTAAGRAPLAGRSTHKATGIALNLLVWVQAAHTLDIAGAIDARFGLGMFGPPLWPLDFMGSASGVDDCTLFRGTECPWQTSQRSFD